MNINPKDRRNYHGLTVEQKKSFFQTIHKTIKGLKCKYIRMYTEPRAKGYRTKLWYSSREIDFARMEVIADTLYTNLKHCSIGDHIKSVEPYFATGSQYGRASSAFYIKFK